MQEAKKIATIMYWANLLKMPIDELRELISDVTKGKSNSRKNLSYSDYLEVISRLKQAWRASEAYLRGKNMRAKIIATMCEIGYKTNDNLPDYDRMTLFLEKHGAVKKPFTEMTFSELQKTVNQVTRMKENYQKPKTVEYDLDNKPYK